MVQQRELSLANESYAAAELAGLLTDPLYYGLGAPRGDGRLVLVLPGLFANDCYLYPLRSWLDRIGFRAVRSTLALNAGCPERLSRQVENELARRRERTSGKRVALIGHSRGGILARAIAARLQDEASHLVLLGSPVGAIIRAAEFGRASLAGAPAANSVADASNRARRLLDPDCNVPDCGCPFPADLQRSLSHQTKVISVYSREDPIVPPWTCPVPGAVNVEVSGTHSGLAYNRGVYKVLASELGSA